MCASERVYVFLSVRFLPFVCLLQLWFWIQFVVVFVIVLFSSSFFLLLSYVGAALLMLYLFLTGWFMLLLLLLSLRFYVFLFFFTLSRSLSFVLTISGPHAMYAFVSGFQ